jgi:hypothetical protein
MSIDKPTRVGGGAPLSTALAVFFAGEDADSVFRGSIEIAARVWPVLPTESAALPQRDFGGHLHCGFATHVPNDSTSCSFTF